MSHKIITIAQQKGGAGKTTLAAHLAVSFSQKGKNVTIIDIDPQASLTDWYKVRLQTLGEDKAGMISAAVSGWRLHSEIDRLKSKADVIIIDSPPHTQTETKTAIRVADLVLIPVQPSPTDLWATDATVELVAKERIPHRLVMNRIVQNSKLSQEISSRFSNLLEPSLGNRVAFASSMLKGLCVTETSPSSAAAQEVEAMRKEVATLLFPEENSLSLAS